PERLAMVDPANKQHEAQGATTDNSNTQFAILALWAARRHGVPMERTLHLVALRFRTSQNQDGTWAYAYRFGGGNPGGPPMTCVGLLGLAVAHGQEAQGRGKVPGGAVAHRPPQDAKVINGFSALAKHIGQPTGRMAELPMVSLYFL